MSCGPHDLFSLATSLAADESASEAQLRCAVSRGYYSVLHSADMLFPKTEKDVRIDGESSHAEIIGRVVRYSNGINPGRASASFIAKLLPRLRRSRNQADYHLNGSITRPEVAETLERVRAVLEKCDDVARKRLADQPGR